MALSSIYRKLAATAAVMAMAGSLWLRAGIVDELPTIRVNGKVMYYYDTLSGDNIYTVAEKLGVSVEDIRKSNPSVQDGVKPRMRLFFPITTEGTATTDAERTHVVQKGESLYGIAHQYNISADELQALNPSTASGVKPGMRLKLPADASETVAQPATDVAEADTLVEPAAAETIEETAAIEVPAEVKDLHVAVILPFMLDETHMGRQTQLYTEFYKGFLLAADTLNAEGRTPVRIRVYDSAANLDTVRAIMRRPEIADMNLILAPDNTDQLHEIVASAPKDALVLNVFAVKDTTYLSSAGSVQTNIPHDEMYERAIEGFMASFSDATPVFISRRGGKADKSEFTDLLKQRLSGKGVIYRTLTFDTNLDDGDLDEFDPNTGQFVFIPASGNRDEFNRIAHALKNLKGRAENPEAVRVFGYPEWATFRGSQLDDICDLTATIYSRYFPTERDYDAERFASLFRRTYGESIIDKQMPVLGILGYDTATMIIEGLRTMAGTGAFPTEFNGIQSGMRLHRVADGGLFNDALFLITYNPGGFISKQLR